MAADPTEQRARVEAVACLAGIAPWKRKRIGRMFRNAHGPVFRNRARGAVHAASARGGAIACWASRVPEGLEEAAAHAGVPLWWIEDGFLRSSGLGAALVQPASLTLDSVCPYYDPSRASDLEAMLETAEFAPEMLARAAALTAAIRGAALTKYNLGGGAVALPEGRRIVLVPGQVEDDRSVILGSAGVRGMRDLLARVRAEEPDAFIVYKPHPDVVAGYRQGRLEQDEALEYADLVTADADLAALLDRVDAVHVLTSLTGFEALLRGREVVTHGQPFYAGWGLTRDRAPLPRRTRRRSLDALVAAALIAYPLYADPASGAPCSPEHLVDALATRGAGQPVSPLRAFAGRVAAWQGGRRNRRARGRET